VNELEQRLSNGEAPDEIEAYLDGLEAAARLAEVRGLSGKAVGALFDRCAARPLSTDHLVPACVDDGVEVRHSGINSMPLFRRFEKRFLRAPSGVAPAGRLWGYNHQAMQAVTGPGYFVVDEPTDGEELTIDYHEVPPVRPRDDWPAVRGNDGFPSNLVYGFMRDGMRRVSADVCAGRACRRGKQMNTWFALVRQA
jgi:hypothetical protein